MTTFSSFRRSAFLALLIGAAGATATFAQTTPATTTTTPPTDSGGWKHHQHHHSDLTSDEKAELKKAHEAALAADPTLASQKEALKAKFQALKAQGSNATPTDWAALRSQHDALRTQMHAAELKQDPALAPIFAKLDAEKQHHHDHHSNSTT